VTLELRHAPFSPLSRSKCHPTQPIDTTTCTAFCHGALRSLGQFWHCLYRPFFALLLGNFNVLAAKLKPGPHRSNSTDDLRLDALGFNVHARRVCCPSCCYWIANNTITFYRNNILDHAKPRYKPDILAILK